MPDLQMKPRYIHIPDSIIPDAPTEPSDPEEKKHIFMDGDMVKVTEDLDKEANAEDFGKSHVAEQLKYLGKVGKIVDQAGPVEKVGNQLHAVYVVEFKDGNQVEFDSLELNKVEDDEDDSLDLDDLDDNAFDSDEMERMQRDAEMELQDLV